MGPLLVAVAWTVATSAPPFQDLRSSIAFEAAPWSADLNKAAEVAERRLDGRLYLYVSDPWRGFRFGYHADEPAYLASGVKMAFMVEVFRQREFRLLSFDEQLLYSAEDIRDGAPRMNRLKVGARVSINTLLDWMMRSSDNAASDLLAKKVGLAKVKDGLEDEGIVGFSRLTYLIDVRRGVYRNVDVSADDLTALEVRTIRWTKIWEPQIRRLESYLGRLPKSVSRAELWNAYDRFYDTKVNAAPMASVGLLLEKMCRGELVSEAASREMLDLMRGARTSTHRLLGKLPNGTKVAHKTGSQFRRLCDMGCNYPSRRSPFGCCRLRQFR